MKRSFYRYLLAFLLVPLAPFISFSQDLTGIWKGYFVSDGGDHYKLEFQISQSASFTANGVTGVSYSYLDVRFYGKATMTGNCIKSSKKLRIREIRTVEVKSLMGGMTCIMNYDLAYSRSGDEEFLEGTYLGKNENPSKYDSSYWGDCGGGKVFLRKVATSDFYIEPFLRDKVKKDVPIIDNEPPRKKDSIKKTPVVVTKPPVKKQVTTNPPVTKKITPPVKKPVTTTTRPVVIKKDTATKTNLPIVKKPVTDTTQKKIPVVKIDKPVLKIPDVLKTRSNELMTSITVSDPEVTVKLYDNGEIDGDTISVYLNKKLMLSSKRLTASPLTIKFKIEEDNSDQELTMVAENLGRIPPNTSLMVVESGTQRFDVRITSTEQKNAVVRFRYQKPK
ncbi:MAG: hypothetical protein HOP10_12515 [Chitinophagaceae bacterium]|nr:hypothetical protein [Chitinophagaceae bacterium]